MSRTTIIQAADKTDILRYMKETWQRRELIYVLSQRDIKVRYTQTALGMIWAVINPLVSLLLLFFVFHIVLDSQTNDVPKLLFTFSGVVAWNYFSKVTGESGLSLIGAQELVRKVYFPRIIIPVSKSVSSLVDLGVSMLLLLILFLEADLPWSWQMIWILPLLCLLVLISTGMAIWISALTIRFRDFQYIVPVLLRIGMFVSPVAYASDAVPPDFEWVIGLNPLTCVIDGFRFALFDMPIDNTLFFMSLGIAVLAGVAGCIYFVRLEKYIADIV